MERCLSWRSQPVTAFLLSTFARRPACQIW